MANKIQIRRGQFAGLPQLDLGEPALTTDTGQVYFGGAAGNIELKTAPPSADRTIYVATTALGGQTVATQGATGLELASGTATGTAANKLVDSAASFTAALVNKTLYNRTDDTWAKVTAVDSPTQLSLSADVMASGELYAVASAVDNIPEAFLRLPDGYVSNITLRISPGTFADDATFIGKNAGGNFSLSVRGSTTGTTTLSGKVDIRQRLALRNLTFTNKIRDFFGADVSWYTCVTSGASKLYVYSGSANYIEGSTIVFGNDPGAYTAVSSTVTKGYTMYVASSALGGNDAIADGLQIYSGSATSTTASKLVDSAANFGTDVVNKTVYNSTDDTWAKVTARDSATQLSLSADIMASGESYVISNAFATVQKAVDSIPGAVNCDTTIKISGETFSESIVVRGKNLTGNYTIKLLGTLTTSDSGTSTGANTNAFPITQTRFYDTGKAWTANAHIGRLLKLTGGTGSSQTHTYRIILGNSSTYLDLTGVWDTLPDNTSTYKILSFATTIDSSSSTGEVYVAPGQKGVTIQHVAFTGASAAGVWVENASVNILGCKFTNANSFNIGIYYTAGATGEANINYIPSTGPGYGIRITSSYVNAYHNYLVAGTANTAALFMETAGGVSISSPYLKGNYLSGGAQGGLYLYANAMLSGMDNCWITGGTYGVYINHNSVARIVANNLIENATSHGIFCNNGHIWFATSASTTNIKNNGGWGVYGQLTSTGQGMTVPTYTTNTSGTWSFAAASYSYGS